MADRVSTVEFSNTDLCLWAMFRLGSFREPVDVEDIYLELFQIAPRKFGWRTRPDLPNFQYGHTTLSRLEKDVFPEFIIRSSSNTRMLSGLGKSWVEANLARFQGVGDQDVVVLPPRVGEDSRLARALRESFAWKAWVDKGEIALEDLADAFGCSLASSRSVWESRMNAIHEASENLSDTEIDDFLSGVRPIVEKQWR